MSCHSLSLLMCALPLFLPIALSADDSRDLAQRVRAELLENQPLSDTETGKILQLQRSDGSWEDIDYDSQIRSNWCSGEHMRRTRNLARCWAKPGQKLYHDPKIGDSIRRAVADWCNHKRQSANWWRRISVSSMPESR